MNTTIDSAPLPQPRVWLGRALFALVLLFLAVDAGCKLLQLPVALEGTVRVGFPAQLVLGIGLVEATCAVAYAIPRTSVVGALLLTAFLGGATAAHVRLGEAFVFPVVFGVMVWGSLLLRDDRLAQVFLHERRGR